MGRRAGEHADDKCVPALQLCTAISHYDALQDMVTNGCARALPRLLPRALLHSPRRALPPSLGLGVPCCIAPRNRLIVFSRKPREPS
jgi:hypothetical protein